MNQIKAGAILNYITIGLNALVGLLFTPYMLKMLGQNEYGLYSLVASIIAYLTLLDFGFGPTVVRYTAKYIAEKKFKEQYSLFGLFIKLYSFIGLIALGIGIILYLNINNLFNQTMSEEDISQARVMILLLLFNLSFTFPMSVFGSIMTAYERFIFQKSIHIAKILLSTLVLIAVLEMGYKAVALVIVQTIFNIGVLFLNLWYCKYHIKIKIIFQKFDWKFINSLINFSIWVFLGDLMFRFYYSTGQFVLGATNGTTQVAIFALGVTLMQMYLMFSVGISGVLLPRITKMVANNKSTEEISNIFIKTGRLQYFIMSLILIGFICLGKPFIYLWAGEEYSTVYYIVIIFFLSTITPLIQNTAIAILQARNQLRFRSLMLVIVGGISIIIQIILSKYYGALGCAIGVGFANILGQGIILNYYYYKYQQLDIIKFWTEIGKMSIIPLAITIIGLISIKYIFIKSWVDLSVATICIVIIYTTLMWKIGLNNSEKKLFLKPLSKFIKNNS